MKLLPAFFGAIFLVATSSFGQSSDSGSSSNAELLREVKALEAKVAALEKRVARYENGQAPNKTSETTAPPKASAAEPAPAANSEAITSSSKASTTDPPPPANTEAVTSSSNEPLFGLGYRSHAILSIGAYGELKFGGQDAPGGWKEGFDAGRVVLLPTLQVTDSIIFNAELEFEHGGIAQDNDDKLTGSV